MRFAFLNNLMDRRFVADRFRRTLLTAVCASACAGASLLAASACTSSPSGSTRVTVPNGASFRVAADSLAHAGVIHWPRLFRWYARFHGGDREIQAGTYLLPRDMAWADVIAALNDGEGLINKLTIPEGYSLAQIAPLLEHLLDVAPESVEVAVRDSALRARLNDPAATLEGYLFPDTYMLPPGTSARRAVTEMVQRFEQEWKPEYDTQAAALGLSRHAIITMASIVEKEAKVPSERPIIAAVYYNRLRLGMPLQADPTVQYVLGKHVDRVFYKDLTVESPYNTYRNAGLPPGPIASPGGPSIRAALQPAKVPYLYFVATPDGHHEFRATLEEHVNAIRAIKKAEKETASANINSASPSSAPVHGRR